MVTKIAEKIAMVIVPGGDLLAAVKIAENAPTITGLVIGFADLVNTFINFGNGTLLTR